MTASNWKRRLVAIAGMMMVASAHADEFGELPKNLDADEQTQSSGARPDFRELLRHVSPTGKAEAAESNAPPPKQDDEQDASAPLQRGLAAWYEHSGKTASGETYTPDGLTAAHRTLPLGTNVRVVYEKTGKAVTVRVNDRISLKAMHRLPLAIELSRQSAQEIGLDGVGEVSIYASGE
ncbi:MAG: hypothetical protein JWN07_422 [Hyphomicrobiales bacterium]|nr:hypothetical protein [Hyphomicrobiales bacterium]